MGANFQFAAQVLSQVPDMVCGWKDRRSLPTSEKYELTRTQTAAAGGRRIYDLILSLISLRKHGLGRLLDSILVVVRSHVQIPRQVPLDSRMQTMTH